MPSSHHPSDKPMIYNDTDDRRVASYRPRDRLTVMNLLQSRTAFILIVLRFEKLLSRFTHSNRIILPSWTILSYTYEGKTYPCDAILAIDTIII